MAVAVQCLAIAFAVAAVCLCATLLACRIAAASRRASLLAMGFASVVSIGLTWLLYAAFLNHFVWQVVRAWAVVGLPVQAVAYAIVSLVLVRTWLPQTSNPTPAAAPRPAQSAGPTATPADAIAAPPSKPPEVRSPATRKPAVFISYRRADSSDVTGRIHDRLAASLGREHVFTDVDSIPLGVDFREHVSGILARTDCMLAVIGRDWLSVADAAGKRRLDDPADLVRIEVETALARGVPVIPLLVQGATMPVKSDLPASLRGLAFRNGMSVRPNPDFHRDVDRLERQLLGYAQDKPV